MGRQGNVPLLFFPRSSWESCASESHRSSMMFYLPTFKAGLEIRRSQLGKVPKIKKPGIKLLTTVKVMVIKMKFIVAKYD